MFSPDHLDFHFPLFTTCLHMLVQFSLASLVLFFLPRFRPRHDSLSNPDNDDRPSPSDSPAERARREMEDEKPLMTRKFYFTRIGPCGAATGLDIGLGNMSLKFISLTFYSMSPVYHSVSFVPPHWICVSFRNSYPFLARYIYLASSLQTTSTHPCLHIFTLSHPLTFPMNPG